ncbi:MAG: TonB-dependent receptor [Deltaproteobacteria bacterium]|nr:TonB-dependent receptor [Deltaproteobacteria bacterium]
MKRQTVLYKTTICVTLLALVSPSVLAQEDAPQESPSEGALVPPKLLQYVEAEYPEEAFAEGLEAEVLAQLDVDEDGNVVEVKIIEPAGHGFDEAAAAAMVQFKFEPALRDGKPIDCLLKYNYRFFIQKVPEEPEAVPEPSAKLSGFVKDLDDRPILGAYVLLTPITDSKSEEETEKLNVETGEEGEFVFSSLLSGRYKIEAIAMGHMKYESEETLEAGEEREVIYRLEAEENDYEIVVRAKRKKPVREVTRQTVTKKEITQIPGTGGDALRAVQNLPGVALSHFMGGELIIRGSSHADSVYSFNSMNAPMLYHFGGMTSIVNSDLLESIDYYPGNFSVRYGRATGGAINVNTRTPNTERFHGYIDLDLFDGAVLAEGPLSKNWSVAASVRRSWVDAIMKGVNMFGDDVRMTMAPRYYDFQLLADYHPSKKNNLKLLFYGSDDRWEMTWDEDDDPNWGAGLELHIWSYQGQAEWTHRFDKHWSNSLSVGFGGFGVTDNEGQMKLDWSVLPLLIRDELTWDPKKYIILRLGTDTDIRWGFLKAHVPGDTYMEGEQYTEASSEQWYEMDGTRFYYYPSLYTELELTAIPRTQVILGVRGDYFSSIDEWGVDPRFSARYELFKTTTLKGGLGLFHQVPSMEYVDKEYGNPDLEPIRAIHYSLGVEQELFDNVNLGVEGFYKDLANVLTGSDEMVVRDGEMVPEHFASTGIGRIYGMEVMLKHEPTDRFFGWVSYTLMKSERKDVPDGNWRLFDHDQTHMLTAVASLNCGWGITAGLRFRLVSGNPDSPTLGSSYDADQDEYYPIYGGNNSVRMPMFHQLDVRVEKKWQWNPLALTVYLDVQNVYNRKNTVSRIENYDFTEHGYIYDLPIFPNLGIKLEY